MTSLSLGVLKQLYHTMQNDIYIYIHPTPVLLNLKLELSILKKIKKKLLVVRQSTSPMKVSKSKVMEMQKNNKKISLFLK